MQAKEREKEIKRRKGNKSKIRKDLMNGEMMGVEVTGVLKFRPAGEYRDLQNKSCLVHGTFGAFCLFLKYPVDLLE